MIKGLNRKLVEEITDTDLGILTSASTGGRLPTGNKRTRRNDLKAQYRVGLDQRRDSLNRAVLGRNV